MELRIITFSSPEENILFDQVLFEQGEQGLSGDVLRFWESKATFIVLGRTSDEKKELLVDNIQRDGIPVLRRTSAGGVVVQGQGCLNFTLILSKDAYPEIALIQTSYNFILTKVLQILSTLGVKAELHPPCDLALAKDSRKFSGNAQRRGKRVILHHGTLLHHFDITLAEKYLHFPLKVPPYRKARSHQDFMVNLGCDPQKIIASFTSVFKIDQERHQLEHQELAHLESLLMQKSWRSSF